MNRLETIAPDFAKNLLKADPAQLRAVIRLACREIISILDEINDDDVIRAKNEVLKNDILSEDLRKKIDDLADSLDQKYLSLYEKNPKDEPAYMPFFTKARALSAISSAGEGNSYACAADAIYEVSSALMDRASLFERLSTVLKVDG